MVLPERAVPVVVEVAGKVVVTLLAVAVFQV